MMLVSQLLKIGQSSLRKRTEDEAVADHADHLDHPIALFVFQHRKDNGIDMHAAQGLAQCRYAFAVMGAVDDDIRAAVKQLKAAGPAGRSQSRTQRPRMKIWNK